MKKPHWLKLLKYRMDYVGRYIRAFGIPGAVRVARKLHGNSGVGQSEVSVMPPGLEHEVHLRQGTSDITVFEKIFVWREYAVEVEHPVENIVDCGGNIGLSAVWFASCYPRAKVYVFEPDSMNFDLLRRNTAGYTNITPVQSAIWNKRCWLKLENPGDQPHAFRFLESDAGGAGLVNACDLENARQKFQMQTLDIVKMDIEGAEKMVFGENYEEWLAVTRMLLIEFHGEEAKRITLFAMSRFQWRHFISGENDCFVKLPAGRGNEEQT